MKTKNLYSNTNWEPMLIALASIKKCPAQLSYRYDIHPLMHWVLPALLLLAQAFSGRFFCAERRVCHNVSQRAWHREMWHHNDYRDNEMIDKFWNKFNVVTKEHFYHGGGKLENRKAVIEALVFNFDLKEKKTKENKQIELELF